MFSLNVIGVARNPSPGNSVLGVCDTNMKTRHCCFENNCLVNCLVASKCITTTTAILALTLSVNCAAFENSSYGMTVLFVYISGYLFDPL